MHNNLFYLNLLDPLLNIHHHHLNYNKLYYLQIYQYNQNKMLYLLFIQLNINHPNMFFINMMYSIHIKNQLIYIIIMLNHYMMLISYQYIYYHSIHIMYFYIKYICIHNILDPLYPHNFILLFFQMYQMNMYYHYLNIPFMNIIQIEQIYQMYNLYIQ